MPGRVNTPFVIILAVVVIAIVAGLIGLNAVLSRSPAQRIERGDDLFARGLYESAADEYGKALSRDQTNYDAILKFANALERCRTNDRQKASQWVGMIRQAWTNAAQLRPNETLPFQKLIEFHSTIARDFSPADPDAWARVQDVCDQALKVDPAFPGAHKARGVAGVRRMALLNLPAERRQATLGHLRAALDAQPADLQTLLALANWHRLEADFQAKTSGQEKLVADLGKQSARYLDSALAAAPQADVRDRLAVARALFDAGKADRARPLVEAIQSAALANPAALQPADFIDLADLIQRTLPADAPVTDPDADPANPDVPGLDRIIDLLALASKTHPEDLRIQIAFATLQVAAGRIPEGLTILRAAGEQRPAATPLQALRLSDLRQQARIAYVNFLLAEAQKQAEPAERTRRIAESRTVIQTIQSDLGDLPVIKLLQGKIAVLEQNWTEALRLLDAASTEFKDNNPDALRLAAQAAKQLRQTGDAARRYERLLTLTPGFLPARVELVRIYLDLNDTLAARRHLDALLAAQPDDPGVQQLQALALAKEGKTADALRLLRRLDPDKHPGHAPLLAQLQMADGKPDQARATLEPYVKANPTDLGSLALLIRISGDKDRALALIDQSEQAGGDPKALSILRTQVQGGDLGAVVLQQIEENTQLDALQQHLARARLHQRMGHNDQARQELDAAAKLNPNHAAVVELQFNDALARRDLDAARKLAERARTLDLDQARGQFFEARVLLADNQLNKAIDALREGLRLRPVFAEGWAMLGQAQLANSDPVAAAESFDNALERQPDNVVALRGLADVAAARNDAPAALRHLQKALTFAPADPDLVAHYLRFEESIGDPQKALNIRQRLATAVPGDWANRRALAILHLRLNQSEPARKVARDLLGDGPADRDNLGAAALVLLSTGEPEAGRKLLQDHVHALGDKAAAEDWMLLGRYLFQADQPDPARSAYDQAFKLEDPARRQATRELASTFLELRNQPKEAADLLASLVKDLPEDRNLALAYATALARSNQLEQADKVLADTVRRHGRDAGTLLLEGLIARARSDRDRALRCFSQAIDDSPRRAPAYYQRADLLSADSAKDLQVIADLNQALQLDPGLIGARQLLAQVYVRRGDRRDAIREYQALLARTPGFAPARVALAEALTLDRQLQARDTLLAESVKLFSAQDAWPRLQALWAHRENRLPDAVAAMKKAVEINPSPVNIADLALFQLRDNQKGDALKTITSKPDYLRDVPVVEAVRGRILAVGNLADQARASFAKALAQSQDWMTLNTVANHAVAGLGVDQTLAVIEEVTATRNSPQEKALIGLLESRLEIEARRFDKAAQRLQSLEPHIPPDGALRVAHQRMIGTAYHQGGEYQKAVDAYQGLLRVDPNDFQALNNAAFILAENLNRADLAMPLAHRARQLAGEDPQILDTLGWVQYKSGNATEARETLRRSVDLQPLPPNLYHLGVVLKHMNLKAAAREMLESARDLSAKQQEKEWLDKAVAALAELDARR